MQNNKYAFVVMFLFLLPFMFSVNGYGDDNHKNKNIPGINRTPSGPPARMSAHPAQVQHNAAQPVATQKNWHQNRNTTATPQANWHHQNNNNNNNNNRNNNWHHNRNNNNQYYYPVYAAPYVSDETYVVDPGADAYINSTSDEGNWSSESGGNVPDDAVAYQENGSTVYHCRAEYRDQEYYGTLVPNDGCYIQDQGVSIRFDQYDVEVN